MDAHIDQSVIVVVAYQIRVPRYSVSSYPESQIFGGWWISSETCVYLRRRWFRNSNKIGKF